MKRIICIFLSLALILAFYVPSFAQENQTEIQNSLGKYYKFTFGEEGDRFDYNSKLNQTYLTIKTAMLW